MRRGPLTAARPVNARSPFFNAIATDVYGSFTAVDLRFPVVIEKTRDAGCRAVRRRPCLRRRKFMHVLRNRAALLVAAVAAALVAVRNKAAMPIRRFRIFSEVWRSPKLQLNGCEM